MSRKQLIIVAVVVALALGAGTFWWLKDDQVSTETTSTAEADNQQTARDNDQPPASDAPLIDEGEGEDRETRKISSPPDFVKERPLVYTSAGHTQASKLKVGQIVSTTCTSEPGVSCHLTFTSNSDPNRVISLDKIITDKQGVATWSWKPTVDVPSGTWKVAAVVGEKKSENETIYIQ